VTRGKPWTVEEERCLKELVEGGSSMRQAAVKMGKSVESVRQKMLKLGLVELEQEKNVCSSSSNVPESAELPNIEEILKQVAFALQSLKTPDLSHAEIQRFRSMIQGAKVYKELFAEYAHYLEIEEKLGAEMGRRETLIKNTKAQQR